MKEFMVFPTVSSLVVLVLFSFSWQCLDIIICHQNNYPVLGFRSKKSITFYTNLHFVAEDANYWQNELCCYQLCTFKNLKNVYGVRALIELLIMIFTNDYYKLFANISNCSKQANTW